jgi:XRE family transcriptional regulator, regulator of sulfur utilization
MKLGKAIQELRKEKGLSQADLAKAAGITQAAMSGIENGNRPNPETLQRLSEALEVPESLIYVMGMEKDDVPAAKKELYDALFPVIKDLVFKIASK